VLRKIPIALEETTGPKEARTLSAPTVQAIKIEDRKAKGIRIIG